MTTENIQDQIRAAAQRGDFAEFSRLEDEYKEKVRAAVAQGIEDRNGNLGPLTDLEREAVHTSVDRILDYDERGLADPVRFAAEWARLVAGDALMVKLELAYNLEMDLTDGHSVSGGILGSALDEVIDQLLPYAQRDGGWYSSAVRKANT